ncbi:sorbitol dehydrogenase-like [Oppia nitens]|uniref:sorbitol dehydrogenase-like n=1 Tax=Oppia nitens TaxID=1686743 RepID=UPI0023DA44B8|nr:sorbitol dehydrogenase-like [Oppia nitens]
MDSRDNLSVVIHKKNDLRVEQSVLPEEPKAYEVQLASHTVGICGSDVHFWKDGKIDKWVINEPIVTGHESSATIVKVGSLVKNLKVGDRVSVEPGVGCMACQTCKDGFYNLCPDVTFHAVPPTGGALRRYYNHSSAFCHKLPENMSYAEGALMEPLAVAVYACKRANITEGSGQRVMVTGAGPVGLLTALAAKALGAQEVCILDINENRLKFAKEMGIEKTLLINTKLDTEALADEVVSLLGANPDITLECSGAESSLNLAIYVTKDGGNVVMVGLNHRKVTVSLASAACREVNLLGIKRYRHSFPLAIYLVGSGKLDVKPLITHRYRIEQALDAFETASSPTAGAIKVQIECFEQN